MLVRLRACALGGVDDEEEEVDPRRAGDHRAHEALVAGHVDEGERPRRSAARAARSRGRSRSRARCSSGSRSVSLPVSARTSVVLPWSTWPAVPTVSPRAEGCRVRGPVSPRLARTATLPTPMRPARARQALLLAILAGVVSPSSWSAGSAVPAPEGTIAYVRVLDCDNLDRDARPRHRANVEADQGVPLPDSAVWPRVVVDRPATRVSDGGRIGARPLHGRQRRQPLPSVAIVHHRSCRALGVVAGDAGARARWPGKGPDRRRCSVPPSRLPIDLVHADGRHRVVQALHAAKPETVEEIGWHRSGESLWVVVSRWGVGHGEDCDWTTQRLVTIDLPSGRRTVVAHGESIGYPTWSSDGRRLAYWDLSTGSPRVVVVRLDGRGGPELEERVVDFAWTPDGRNLVVGGFGVLGVKPAAGGTLRVLVRGPTSSTLPIAAVSADWIALPSERGYTFVSLAGSASKRVRLDPRRTNVPAPISLR